MRSVPGANRLIHGAEAAVVESIRFGASLERKQPEAAQEGGMGKSGAEYQVDAQNTVTEDLIGERRLWTAVVVSAVEDWRNGSLRTQRKAQEFLFGSSTDFSTVCARAGLEPGSFRARLLKLGKLVEMQGTVTPAIAA
jgi:hypothetical protein